jgi:hypothetical protein
MAVLTARMTRSLPPVDAQLLRLIRVLSFFVVADYPHGLFQGR